MGVPRIFVTNVCRLTRLVLAHVFIDRDSASLLKISKSQDPTRYTLCFWFLDMDVLLTSEWFIVCLHWTRPISHLVTVDVHSRKTKSARFSTREHKLVSNSCFCWNWPGSMRFWSCLRLFTSHFVFNASSHMPKFTIYKVLTCL